MVEAMRSESAIPITSLQVDGGMTANDLLMQFQADILDLPIRRPQMTETTAQGAAFAAGLAAGVWRDEEELRSLVAAGREWRPRMAAAERERLTAGWRKAVERSFGWVESGTVGAAAERAKEDECGDN